jgi:hypothetical protein
MRVLKLFYMPAILIVLGAVFAVLPVDAKTKRFLMIIISVAAVIWLLAVLSLVTGYVVPSSDWFH